MLPTRRQFLWLSLGAVGAAAAGGGFIYADTRDVVVERITISLKRLPEAFDGFTIAQLSDIHYLDYLDEDYFRSAIDQVNALRPDVVALTGDFVTRSLLRRSPKIGSDVAEPCAAALSRLNPKLDVFACLGNHDIATGPALVTNALTRQGITVFDNTAREIQRNRARLWFAGLPSMLSRESNVKRAIERIPQGECTVLLMHEPDYADIASRFPIDFQMSGHTHGGQVRLPLLGATVLPLHGRKYPIGLRKVGNLKLYTNRGLGVVELPIRILCPPEITLYTLRRA